MNRLNVSIVTYNTDDAELRRCLDSLESPLVKTVYIVDNSSRESTRSITVERGNTQYIPTENRGFGAGHNQALQLSMDDNDVEFHLVLNSDVCFNPSVIDGLMAVMERYAGVGQIQPRIMYPDGSPQYTVRRLPTPLDVFGRRFLPASMMRCRNNRYLLRDLDLDVARNVPYHQGSFMLLRIDALRRVGLFDERFFMYPEDIDLTRRIHEHYVTLYYPALSVVHDHRAESYRSWRMLWIHMVNMVRYFNKWGWFVDCRRRKANRRIAMATVDICL